MNKETQSWKGYNVVTKSGKTLGWVSKVIFNGSISPQLLRLRPVSLVWLPEFVTGAYEISAFGVAAPCKNKLVAFSDSGRGVTLKRKGLLMKLGIVKTSWLLNPPGHLLEIPFSDDDGEGPSSAPLPLRPNPSPRDPGIALRIDQ